MKKICTILSGLILTSFFFNSCSLRKERPIISQGEVQLSQNSEDISEKNIKTQTWQPTIQKIAVIFGYGFNAKDFVDETLKNLETRFGLSKNDGEILPLIYPDDFKNGSRTNISLITKKLSNVELKGILILGAPEGTSVALNRLVDSYGKTSPFPIISAFSQDEILQTEYISTIVLDKDLKAELDGNFEKTEEEQNYIPNLQEFIINSVRLCKNADLPFEKNASLLEFAKKIGKNNKITRYTDTETGLFSINHFYIQ